MLSLLLLAETNKGERKMRYLLIAIMFLICGCDKVCFIAAEEDTDSDSDSEDAGSDSGSDTDSDTDSETDTETVEEACEDMAIYVDYCFGEELDVEDCINLANAGHGITICQLDCPSNEIPASCSAYEDCFEECEE